MAILRPLPSSTVVQRNLAQVRLRRKSIEQVRSLWWWGRQGKAWGSSQHEDIEERMLRHQKIMMHRYSKALRRRSMWDREHSPLPWAWCIPSRLRAIRLDSKELSSTAQLRAKLEEHENPKRDPGRPWEEYHKDFESFKAAVDKAIERDPYGTLFGKRLRSPPTENNSSWTSWSWIFDPKEIKDEKSATTEAQDKGKEPVLQSSSDPTTSSTASESPKSSEPNSAPKTIHKYSSMKTETIMTSGLRSKQISVQYSGEYVYDPISGRKVLKQTPHATSNKSKSVGTNGALSKPGTSSDTTKTPLWKKLFFTEHGAQIPVKLYEPKVFGFDVKKSTVKESDKPLTESKGIKSDAFENSRKRQYNQLRAATLGNTIDSSNFDQRWNAKNTEEKPKKDIDEAEEKRVRFSPAPDDTKPLFSGTAYEGRAPESDLAPSSTTSDWLVKEGFQRRAPLTIPELAHSPSPPGAPREPASKLEPALDRARSSAVEIPVKIFGDKLQPAIDRFKEPGLKKGGVDGQHVAEPTTDKREDVDLLRASDVRAAARAARVTKQALEEKKREARVALEKDFGSRATPERDADGISSKPTILSRTDILSQNLSNVWKHVKQYPAGIVAKTMRSIGVAQDNKDEKTLATTPKQSESVQVSTTDAQAVSSGGKSQETEMLLGLARSLRNVYEEENGNIDNAAFKLRASQYNTRPSQHDLPPKRAKMYEPSVKPGVVRNLEIEKHTQVFEPKFAEMVDKAKSIKRELHDISLSVEALKSQRPISATSEKPLAQIPSEPSAVSNFPSNCQLGKPQQSGARLDFESPFILLSYDKGTDDVQVTSVKALTGTAGAEAHETNPMAAIGYLHKPAAFTKHFVDLDKHGYKLISGGDNMLVFQKSAKATAAITIPATQNAGPPTELDDETVAELSLASLTSAAELRKSIAVQEAAAQPKTSPKLNRQQDGLQAARVLDNIPSTIPAPGPSAPIAPPTSRPAPSSAPAPKTPASTDSSTRAKAASKPLPGSRPPRVRRQEQVFSGQRLAPSNEPQAIQPDPTAHFPPKMITTGFSEDQNSSSSSSSHEQLGFFRRFSRAVRRVVLTALAFGTGAYAIGVVAEGLGAQAQHNRIAGEGPRKKIVISTPEVPESLARQRPGIFSTESSR